MIYGIGVDLVRIPRIKEAVERWGDRFTDRVYTEREKDFCLGRSNRTRCWAMRFAAKEAFSKAIGFGMRQGIRWRDIEVEHNVYGRPGLILHGRALAACREAGIRGNFLTLTDEGEYAVAVVVLEV